MFLAAVALLLGGALGYLISLARSAKTITALKAENAAALRDLSAAAGQINTLTWQINTQRADTAKAEATDAAILAIRNLVSGLGAYTQEADRRRVSDEATLREQLQTIATSTLKFTQALSSSQARGKYGEVQLEMLLENAGLMEGVHYQSQSSSIGYGDNVLRPDIKILLPGGSTIYVDSKFPFDKYLQAFESTSDQERTTLMSEHAKDLLKHVDVLAKRGYHDDDASPDFVVLFAPFESILSEALQADPQILEKAFAKGVTIATPTTMLALLRTVGYIFGKNKMAQSASQIQELAGELLKRVSLLHAKLSTLGERIKSSERAYNDVIATAESSIMLPAKKMQALGVGPSTAVRPLLVIDDDVRVLKPTTETAEEVDLQLQLDQVHHDAGEL